MIIVDNSGSISSTEFTDMKRSIDSLSSKILRNYNNTKIAIVQYASQNASNHTYHFSIPFTDSFSVATSWQRAYATGGVIQSSYFQDHLPGSLSKMRRDSIWEIGKTLDLKTDSCNTSFIIFTDAAYGGTGCCSHLINNNASLAPLAMAGFGEYNYLKSTYLSKFVTYHVAFGTGTTAHQAGAAISSVGGSYTGTISVNLGDPEGSGVSPRIYFPNTTFIIPTSTSSSLVSILLSGLQSIFSNSVCLGDSTSFTLPSSLSFSSTKWDFGDGNTDTNNVSPKHLYSAAGTYYVSVIFQINGTSCIDTVTDSVIVFPQINSNYNVITSCAGMTTSFNAISPGTYQSVKWDFGDGNFSSSFPSTSNVYSTAGTYNTSLLLKKSSSCFDTTQQTIQIKDISFSVRKTTTTISAWDTTATYQWLDCATGYSILTGETYWNFIPTAHGSYAVEVKKNGCVDTSVCVPFYVLGTEEQITTNFTLFPNPAKDELIIIIDENFKRFSIVIFDSQGRKVLESSTNLNRTLLDISSLKKGVYYIELSQGDNRKTKKLLKIN